MAHHGLWANFANLGHKQIHTASLADVVYIFYTAFMLGFNPPFLMCNCTPEGPGLLCLNMMLLQKAEVAYVNAAASS